MKSLFFDSPSCASPSPVITASSIVSLIPAMMLACGLVCCLRTCLLLCLFAPLNTYSVVAKKGLEFDQLCFTAVYLVLNSITKLSVIEILNIILSGGFKIACFLGIFLKVYDVV